MGENKLNSAKLVGELSKLAVEISENTKTDVFVRYSPHVNDVMIDIHLNGWTSDRHKPTYLSINLKTGDVYEPSTSTNLLNGQKWHIGMVFNYLNSML